MAYYGKLFTFDKEDNFSNYIDSMKLASSDMATRMSAKRKFTFDKNGDTYTYAVQNLDGSEAHTFSFKSGDTIERKISGVDRTAKLTFTVDGNNLIEVITGDDKTRFITVKKEFTADSVKETFTTSFWDSAAYRYYKA